MLHPARIGLDYRLVPSYLSMTCLVTAAPHNNSMIDLFARRSKVATRAIGIADVLTPVQVRVFSDCEMRWLPTPARSSRSAHGQHGARWGHSRGAHHQLPPQARMQGRSPDRSRSGTVPEGMAKAAADG